MDELQQSIFKTPISPPQMKRLYYLCVPPNKRILLPFRLIENGPKIILEAILQSLVSLPDNEDGTHPLFEFVGRIISLLDKTKGDILLENTSGALKTWLYEMEDFLGREVMPEVLQKRISSSGN